MDSEENQNSGVKNSSPSQGFQNAFASSKMNNSFGPKLSIKLQDNNYLLWNQQVEDVILTQKMHKVVVNPQIPQKFNSVQDRVSGTLSDEYEAWLVQDQVVFIWLLSMISESVLPRVLACKHAYEVWDKIHQYYNAQMKVRVRQLRVKLKSTKKGDKSITKFVLRIKAIANSLLAVGDSISEQDQIDSILDGLPEKYNPFVMQISSVGEISSRTANIAHSSHDNHGSRGTSRGRGSRFARGRGRGRSRTTSGPTRNHTTCHLCGKYGYYVVDCWHRYDENFMPPNANSSQSNDVDNSGSIQDSTHNASQTSQVVAMVATTSQASPNQPYAFTQEYSLPSQLESQAWFADSGF